MGLFQPNVGDCCCPHTFVASRYELFLYPVRLRQYLLADPALWVEDDVRGGHSQNTNGGNRRKKKNRTIVIRHHGRKTNTPCYRGRNTKGTQRTERREAMCMYRTVLSTPASSKMVVE